VGALARCDAIDAAISNQMADDPEPGVRRRLAEELGRNRPTDPAPGAQALQVALRLVHDADPMVAEAAAWSIGELAGPAPDDPTDLDGLDDLDAPDAPGHRAVSDGAHAIDPNAASGSDETTEVTVVLADVATTHPDALVRESAVAALGAIGNVAGLPAVLHATSDKPAVRRRAVIALASFLGQPGVEEALQRATADRDWQVRQAADMLLESDD
jgi:HEAT repeat protein